MRQNQNQPTSEDYVIGEVKATFFFNESNFYRVMSVEIDETNTMYSEKEIVMTGNFPTIQDGTTYHFKGKLVDHAKYGVQFQVTSYEAQKITSKEGLIRFLSSEQFPGIGDTIASRIVDAFGDQTIDTILNDAEALKVVKGLSKKTRTMLHERMVEQRGNEQVFVKLAEMGFSSRLAGQIYGLYHNEAVEIIEENPYILIDDIRGFGFQKADQIALNIGFPLDSPVRVAGGVMFVLNLATFESGNTFVMEEPLIEKTQEVLMHGQSQFIDAKLIEDTISDMNETGKLILSEEGRVALPTLYFAEVGIAKMMGQMQQPQYQPQYPGVDLDEEIQKLEQDLGISYGQAQKKAIKEALTSKMFILTGGPGTGKTTVLNGIVQLYARLNNISLNVEEYDPGAFPISLAAPTGRAAKRMTEMIHLPASTIHRLLGLTGEEDDSEESGMQLETDLLIIDEMSMVDTWLAYKLLSSVPSFMQVIFVGDKDQLASVGPGQVLADLLSSQTVKTRELDEIYRQKNQSTIVQLAHQIKQGIVPKDLMMNQRDRSFFKVQANQIADLVAIVAKRAVDKGYQKRDVQVLAPLYKGQAGINHINERLQAVLNPNDDGKRRELVYFEQTFRVGDKVLQLKNQAEKNVFNGDLGEIVAIFFAKETTNKVDQIVVQFDEVEVTYERNDFNEITLAYCTSIHKSQGSEFPIVIVPLVPQHHRMLKRNLLYTGITRAKQSLIMCGEPQAFQTAIQNVDASRQTQLKDFLMEAVDIDERMATAVAAEIEEKDATTAKNQAESRAETTSDGDLAENSSPGTGDATEEHVYQGATANSDSAVEDFCLTADLVLSHSIDPMIGMEGIKPEDF
ncbi:SF1B family DNA helicase RecD2 [Aerococcus urinaeequi]|uniref:SF1B family DNA helicase RecD2 n=1 Tax=Aerococcus urinaeequi TaxID=51665 RepID=UPI003ED8CB26